MKRAHSVYISMMIILRITVCSWSISLRRLKNRYDEIKERDEAIKMDYFKIIMKGLEWQVRGSGIKRRRTLDNLEFRIRGNNKDGLVELVMILWQ